MENYYKIGIDVGGTNTDAVLIDAHRNILSKTKQTSSDNVSTGVYNALSFILEDAQIDVSKIKSIVLGSTKCLNAIIERKGLCKTASIRLCLPATEDVPLHFDCPKDFKSLFQEHLYMVKGGHEFDGREIAPLDENHLLSIAHKLKGKIESIAICGIFSFVNDAHEKRARNIFKSVLGPDIPISISSEIGGLGILERENATLLNASLYKVAKQMVEGFKEAVVKLNLASDLFIVQNNGTIISLEQAKSFPVLTVSCGPTNSIRGAGALSGISEGIVLDVGGTSTDGGVLEKGFPRKSSIAAVIGGIATNFRVPDIVTIALGGGTIIRNQSELSLGPDSVGFRLKEKALSFGGECCTLTDYAIAENKLSIDGVDKNKLFLRLAANGILLNDLAEIKEIISVKTGHLIDALKTSKKDIPVVLVGGGAPLINQQLEGVSQLIIPEHYEVANAFGAAISKVIGQAEAIVNIQEEPKEIALERVKQQAIKKALEQGAILGSIEVLNISTKTIAYVNDMVTIKVEVSGSLD